MTKNPTTNAFLKVLKKETMFQNFQNFKKSFFKTVPLSLTLQVCSPEFLTQRKMCPVSVLR